ncbi:uncharacterized protein MELLADRAFT_111838 [Melampsora larici-populina 98AG31]|uniref:Secreted protein n=1 Tax=Melampsora larici-populina (strain 98AG31 / pathotype 3-4-7) TaxID=747676 RepID=F4S4I3_MELLP|nr:uncharacterized protein MELLADRAFT_111838 [Melampsora larici-populina 98AG31]EGG00417.1 hypothetical protein MELLADRAFT_111838 [Melampsora larici-populina 98AG31]
MRPKLQCISRIVILLNLKLSIYASTSKEEINIQTDRVSTKWRGTFVATGLKTWETLESPSFSNQVLNPATRIPISEIKNQFAHPDEHMLDELKMNAHKSWQGTFHLSNLHVQTHITFMFLNDAIPNSPSFARHPTLCTSEEVPHKPRGLTKKLLRRSPALEGLVHGASNIGEVAQGSKAAETISDINKAHDISGSSKALSGTDTAKLGKADSFRGKISRLDPVPTLSRTKSLPKSLKGIDQQGTLEAMDLRFDKSLFQLTDDIMEREPKGPYVELDKEEMIYQRKTQRPLTFEAFLALYAEKNLFKAIIDGESDMQTINALADIVEKQRGRYVEVLKDGIKKGVEVKTFLAYTSVLDEHMDVLYMRKSIWAHEVSPNQIEKAKNPPERAARISFPETLAEDETRGKDSKTNWQKSLSEITADEYMNHMYKKKSSIEIIPAEDPSIEKVTAYAIDAAEDERILHSELTPTNYFAARASRNLYQWHLQSYVEKHGIDFSLFTDLQEIFNQKGIQLEIQTPRQSKVLVWYDKFAAKFQKMMRGIKKIFKKFLTKKPPQRTSSFVDPREIL